MKVIFFITEGNENTSYITNCIEEQIEWRDKSINSLLPQSYLRNKSAIVCEGTGYPSKQPHRGVNLLG